MRSRIFWICSTLITFVILFSEATAQNAITGTGFTAGWPSSCNNGTGLVYFTPSAGTSYSSGALTPTGIGNRFWRLAVGWNNSFKQMKNGTGSGDVSVNPGEAYTLDAACTSNGAMFFNVTSTNFRYVFKTADAGANPSGNWVFFEIQGTVREILSQSRSTVFKDQATTITANLSGSLSAGQGVYLRYSTDINFGTSSVLPMTGSNSTYTATIPANIHVAGTTIYYYLFTSGQTNVASNGSNADLYTINFLRNGAANFSYTVPNLTGGRIPFAGTNDILRDEANLYWDSTINRLEINRVPGSNIMNNLSLYVNGSMEAVGHGKFQKLWAWNVAPSDTTSLYAEVCLKTRRAGGLDYRWSMKSGSTGGGWGSTRNGFDLWEEPETVPETLDSRRRLVIHPSERNGELAQNVAPLIIGSRGQVAIGYTNRFIDTFNNNSSPYTLTVNGMVSATKLKITQTPWADYVFAKNYQLRSLAELNGYITKYKHLPDVPTTAEVAAKGIDLGETQAMLLRKIEELTLYLIAQDKQNKLQSQKIATLEKQLKQIKAKK